MVDIENTLILINSKDKTVAVSSWSFDKQQSVIWITYNDGMKYPYNSKNVKIFESPELIDITDKLILVNDFPCSGIVKILKFSSYARIYYKTGYKEAPTPYKLVFINGKMNLQW